MSQQVTTDPRTAWKLELPSLTGPSVTLREPVPADVGIVLEVLHSLEATSFGLEHALSEEAAITLIGRMREARSAGRACSYLVTLGQGGRSVGLFQVRALDPVFENAEWEATLLPSVRGSGLFMESAQLVAGFVFGTLGSHRLEARAILESGRANGALRKLGAMQEGVLRRSLRRDGRYFDQVLWSLLASDWGQRRTSAGAWVH